MVTIDYSNEDFRPHSEDVFLVRKEDRVYFLDEIEIYAEVCCKNENLLLVRMPPAPETALITSED